VKGGKAAVKGWLETSDTTAADFVRATARRGVRHFIYTDISRDGMMEGANVESTAALAKAVSTPVIASGGVNSVRDIERLRDCGSPISGVVIGRALYDGRIDPAAALMTARCQD
jgi:phosphoribosylformimino-5-aminoimidazole carboxamide ribotide isomerase